MVALFKVEPKHVMTSILPIFIRGALKTPQVHSTPIENKEALHKRNFDVSQPTRNLRHGATVHDQTCTCVQFEVEDFLNTCC